MKKVRYLGLATLVAALVAIPAWAQKGGRGIGKTKAPAVGNQAPARSSSVPLPASVARSNKGGQVRGIHRAEQVQQTRTHGDTQHGVASAPGLERAGERHTERSRVERRKAAGKGQKVTPRPGGGKDTSKNQKE